jgi:20S proteasome alpha/beta subunit
MLGHLAYLPQSLRLRYLRRREKRDVTTCVAALCCEGKAIVLVADKMFGLGYIESEPDISKIRPIHKYWRVMIAGNGIAPAFAILAAARDKLAAIPAPSVELVMDSVEAAYQEKRIHDAEAYYLTPIGWTLAEFKSDGLIKLGEVAASQIRDSIDEFEYELDLLVAGFDDHGEGQLFSVSSDRRGIAARHDLGFYAVGSGETNARFIMTHRRIAPKMVLREALFYALEGKYYGELASGVGLRTDILVMRPDEEDLAIHEDNVDILMTRICEQVDPRELADRHVKLLNTVPELDGIPPMEKPSARKKRESKEQKEREKWAKEQK